MGNRASAAEDTLAYRTGYPGKLDDPQLQENLRFYRGEIRTVPGKDFVTGFHTCVEEGGRRGDYDWLEWDHSYIQWLFPIREKGLNWQAQELQLAEARAIAADPALQRRVVESYRTMLEFYGMQLHDPATGEVRRGPRGQYEARYRNLATSFHNNLRITRILKCLGEMGLEHMKRPFVEHVLREVYLHGELVPCRVSCLDYWAQTLRGEEDRAAVAAFAERLHREHPLAKEEEEDQYDWDEWDAGSDEGYSGWPSDAGDDGYRAGHDGYDAEPAAAAPAAPAAPAGTGAAAPPTAVALPDSPAAPAAAAGPPEGAA